MKYKFSDTGFMIHDLRLIKFCIRHFTSCIAVMLILQSFDVLGQNEPHKVNIIGRAQENAIVLRIAPGSPTLWELGNKHGYMIERYTVTRGKQYLGNKEKKLLTPAPLKPLPLAQWEPIAANNEFAEVAAEAIYGETFELSTNFEQDIMQVYNKAKELESRYSFALFSADISLDVAQASGLYLKDSDVKKGERYLYRVYSLVPQTIIPTDTGFVYISLEDFAPLPEIKDVKVQFADKMAMVSWNTRYLQSAYSAYWIERSEDGKNFKRTNEMPFVNLYPEEITDPGIAYKIDSLKENNRTYYYRVQGISLFGETGPPSEIVKGEGAEALGESPAIRKVEAINQQGLIQWEFPKEKESTIKGFEILRSENSDTGFKSISSVLPVTARSFTDTKPEGTNYYKVKALGKNGEASFSFPSLYQLEDSIPPLAPTGVVGFVDTAGVVTLHWNNNAEKDLGGYRVYRSNFKNAEFSQVTSAPVDTAGYQEKIALQNLTKEIYYKVQAFDTRFNPSQFSAVIKLLKPDVVPPVPPVMKEWKADQDKLLLVWSPSPSKDVSVYNLKMKSTSESGWLVTKAFAPTDKMSHQYANLKSGSYDFVIEAKDSAGNAGVSKVLKVKVAGGSRAPIKNVKAVAERDKKKIILTWKYEDKDATKILIYRAEGDHPVTLYKTIPGKSTRFEDEQVVINTTYNYYLKIVFEGGEESGFGDRISIKY